MQPARLTALVGGALLLAAASTVGAWRIVRPEVEQVQPPRLSWKQTAEHIYVHIHNVNRTWGLRDQPVHVYLSGEEHHLVSFHPGQVHRITPDGKPFECCRISYLPPGGDYTLTLLPNPLKVAGVRVEIRDEKAWKRMKPERG